MVRFALAAVVCLALVGCKKDPPAAAPEEKRDVAAPAEVAPQEEPADEKLDEASLKKYIAYETDLVARTPAYLEKHMALSQEVSGGKGGPVSLEKLVALTRGFDLENEKALAKAKLLPAQLERWDALVNNVIFPRATGAPAAMQKAANEMRMKAKTLPADQQETAQQTIKELEAQIAATNGQVEARKQYGDVPVDLALKHEAELKTLHDQRMSFLTQLGGAGAGETK
jgi:hypothetical protein